jgi:antibiotic biosynthesis monooxygenase (ABM) superfamily enzyme
MMLASVPKRKPPEPPAKYKLWLNILILVYLAEWVASGAKFLPWIESWKLLSPNFSLFLYLAVIVFVLVFAALDVFVFLLTYTKYDNDEDGDETSTTYGLGRWLAMGRVKWTKKYEDNFFVDLISIPIYILENGFDMFKFRTPDMILNASGRGANIAPGAAPAAPAQGPSKFKVKGNVTIQMDYRIASSNFRPYAEWKERLADMVRGMGGFLVDDGDDSTDIDSMRHERRRSSLLLSTPEFPVVADDEKGMVTIQEGDDDGDDDEEKEVKPPPTPPAPATPTTAMRKVTLKFISIDLLNTWMASPMREELVNEVEDLSVKVTAPPRPTRSRKTTIRGVGLGDGGRDRRKTDAFTDLLTRQGERMPARTPKKWKVAWLTTLALYFSIIWTRQFLPYYFSAEVWNLDSTHVRLQSLVKITFSTYLNSFVMTPLFLFLFGDWVQRKEGEHNGNEPWKTLNEGMPSLWIKSAVTVAFYGGCGITWIVRAATETGGPVAGQA